MEQPPEKLPALVIPPKLPENRVYPGELVNYDHKGLADFLNVLREKPNEKTEVKDNPFTKSRYIPIGLVEAKLDHYFAGLWETRKPKWQVIANEIVMTIELRVLHPVAGVWLRRIGAAGVQIQLRAEYEVDEQGKPVLDEKGKKVKKEQDILDASKKIINTLGKDFPHVKAEAVKNAAKSFGAILGRDLNREFDDDAEELTIEEAAADIALVQTRADLKEYYNNLPPAMKSDKRIKDALKTKEEELKSKGKKETKE